MAVQGEQGGSAAGAGSVGDSLPMQLECVAGEPCEGGKEVGGGEGVKGCCWMGSESGMWRHVWAGVGYARSMGSWPCGWAGLD